MTNPTDVLLAERGKTNGNYADLAVTAQNIKSVVVNAPGYEKLNAVQRESLDLIATKIARILSGDPDHADHWDDIAGYARLPVVTRVSL